MLQEPILAPVVKALEYYSDMNQKMEQDKEAVKLKQVGRKISSTIDPKVSSGIMFSYWSSDLIKGLSF